MSRVWKKAEAGREHTGPRDSQRTARSWSAGAPAALARARPQLAGPPEPERTSAAGRAALEPIAVIGLSGRYPGADDLGELWALLCEGRDCIREVPKDRWDADALFDPVRHRPGKIYAKWGGFLADIAGFDHQFFGIPRSDADFLDPQERLWLETAWHTFEDAGYTPAGVRDRSIGIFVGVMSNMYQKLSTQVNGVSLSPFGSYASIANRTSYQFDLHGPSLALDTMCSSSLTAIHLACESIWRGESELALAGGVNVIVHPDKYVTQCLGGWFSTDGRCRSFGAGGDGYVPGEGVGAVLLKRLSEAERDGDHVYGLIRGSAVNHCGRTHSYFVPNPKAQADVLRQAWERAGIEPRAIGYLEAHGTGTTLGDPIEVRGIAKAFEGFTPDRQFCALGSVKSNVGHLESAAGVAALTKVLLQLRHRKLVPSLHNDPPNPHIAFERSPVYLQRALEDWREPQPGGRRLAGISSFGAGGSNAHLVVEEYAAAPRPAAADEGGPHLVLLSARDAEGLRRYARRWADFLERDARQEAGVRLVDLAYTSQVGRAALPERLACVVHSKRELRDALEGYGRGEKEEGCLIVGRAGEGQSASTLLDGPEGERILRLLLETASWRKLAQLWVMGAQIDFQSVHGQERPCRVPVPGYPFERTRCWLPESEAVTVEGRVVSSTPTPTAEPEPAAPPPQPPVAEGGREGRDDTLLDDVLDTLAHVSPLPRSRFRPERRLFTELNVDSLMMASFTSRMVARYPGLTLEAGAYSAEMTVGELVDVIRARLEGPVEGDPSDLRFERFDEVLAARRHREEAAKHGLQGLRARPGPNGVELAQDGRTWVNFTTYDFLGLARDERVLDGATRAVQQYGASASASRPVGGEIPLYQDFEQHLARFLGTEAAVLFVSGHATNVTTIEILFGAGDLVLVDEGSPFSSIVEGGLVSGAEVMSFPHGDLQALDGILQAVRQRYRKVLVAVEAVCATDGRIADLPRLVELKKRHQTFLLVDEDNSFGVLGATGRGLCEHHGVEPREVDVISCGLNKSLASCGGFIAGDGALVHYVKCTATSLIFAASIAPMSTGAAHAALEVLEREPERGARVRQAAERLRELLRARGWRVAAGCSPVVTLRTPEDAVCLRTAKRLEERGIAVEHHPRNDEARVPALLRLVVTAEHTEAHLRLLAEALDESRADWVEVDARVAWSPPARRSRIAREVRDLQATGAAYEGPVPERYVRVAAFPEYQGLVARQAAVPKDVQVYWRPHEGIVNDRMTVGGTPTINFSSFNYLALSGHPQVIEAVGQAIRQYGTSASSPRPASGTLAIHEELERDIADFLGVEAAVVFDAGHNTNVSSLGSLFGPGDLVLHDSLSHNSMIQGALLSGASRMPFPHNDYQRVDEILTEVRGRYRRVCVAIEGAYSQDGDVPDLAKFVEVKKRHRALLFVDEAHSIGAIGKTGRGVCEHAGVAPGDVDILMGTLSKALGTSGGYVAGCSALVEYLRQIPCYVHNVNISPAVAAAAREAIRMIRRHPERVRTLHERARLFVELARQEGLDIGRSRDTAVIPLMTYSSQVAYGLSYGLLQKGITTHPFTYPVVPENQARLRMFVNSDHSEEQIRYAVRCAGELYRRLKAEEKA